MLGGEIVKIFKFALLAAVLVLAATGAAIPFAPRFMLQAFASSNNLDLRYGAIRNAGMGGMSFDNLSLVDKSRGIGISSRDAVIKFSWNGPDPRNMKAGFDLKDVRFIKKTPDIKPASYDTLDGLVALPFGMDMVYSEISGNVTSSGGDVTVSDFMAKSDMVKLALNGRMGRDNTIKSDIVIYFSNDLTNKIPRELTKLVLTNEDENWKSLSVKLEGNYKMPTIQVSSKLFRLSIGVKEGS
jgi:hypothetical protein